MAELGITIFLWNGIASLANFFIVLLSQIINDYILQLQTHFNIISMDNIFSLSGEQLGKYFEKYNELMDVTQRLLTGKNNVNGRDLLYFSVEAFISLLEVDPSQNVIEVLSCIKQQQLNNLKPVKKPLVHYGSVLEKDDHTVTICCPTRQQPIFEINMLIHHTTLSNGAQIDQGTLCEIIFDGEDIIDVIFHDRQYYTIHPSVLENNFLAQVPAISAIQVNNEESYQQLSKSKTSHDPQENSSHSLHLDNNSIQDFTKNLVNSIYDNFFNEHETSLTNSQLDHQPTIYSSQLINQQSEPYFSGQNQSIFDQENHTSALQKSNIEATGSHAEPTNSKTKFCLKESISQQVITKLSLQPQSTKQYQISTGIWMIGRVSFLIDNIAFIVVPQKYLDNLEECKLQGDQHSKKEIQQLRDFDISKQLGVVVAVQLNCCKFNNSVEFQKKLQNQRNQKNSLLQRGDIVQFEVTAGYGMNHVGVSQGNQYYPLFSSPYGNSGVRKQPADDFNEYYKQFSDDEKMNCYADHIKVIDRIERQQVSKQHLIHQKTYHGYVYTFNEQDGYGFIKSFGELRIAGDYSQGFEVYFKLQQDQRKQYVPQRGDYVQFKSHWVDEKAQARDIRLIIRNGIFKLTIQCVGICPPFAVFQITDEQQSTPNNTNSNILNTEDLRNSKEKYNKLAELKQNLLFTKIKSSFQIRLGQKFIGDFDPDITSHFKAINLQLDIQQQHHHMSFQLNANPSSQLKRQSSDIFPLSWETKLGYRRNAPFFGKPELVQDQKVGILIHFDSEVKDGQLFLNRSGMTLRPEFILRDADSIADLTGAAQYFSIYRNDTNFAIAQGVEYSSFRAMALSAEFVYFRHDDLPVGFLIRRVCTPTQCLYMREVTIKCSLDVQKQYECFVLDNVVYVQADVEATTLEEGDEVQ